MWTEADEKLLKELEQRKRTWEEQQYDKILSFVSSRISGVGAYLGPQEISGLASAISKNLKDWKQFLREKV